MRLHLKISSRDLSIPFNHQSYLVGTVHKWLGYNKEHGEVSLYSFSRLEGGKKTTDGLKFEREASFFISSYDIILMKKIIAGIQKDPTLFYGLEVTEIIMEPDPDLTNRVLFFTGSPILIKRKVNDKIDHILYNDLRASACMKETLLKKMTIAGIVDETFDIKFDLTANNISKKLIDYKGIKNKANWCPVIINGKPETKLFAWNVGIGNSTGIGFGAIK